MFGPATTEALEKYHLLKRMSPDQEDITLKLLIAHEEALLAFAEAELTGDDSHSLDPIRNVLTRLSAD
jgi:hypothetical protein